uniref:Cytochrome P450 CYP1 n=1 Tax=Wolfiporia cocos TaxID=81056 RepID=A0A7T1TSU2_9APHY|nr:cytochrome P450 CYP1 [Wolfiporia cocos]
MDRITVFLLILPLAILASHLIKKNIARYPLPPGPPGFPIIGNALQMPLEKEWRVLADWAMKYGEIMHLSVLGQHVIVLSSADVITELLEKRSANYSDRPRFPMAGEMIGYSDYISITPYGMYHREGRKLMMNALAARKTTGISDLQESQALQLCRRLLDTPADFRSHIRWFVCSTAFEFIYGIHVDRFDDPIIQSVETVAEDFSRTVKPGAFFMDTFPFLKYVPDWFPGARFKTIVKECRERLVFARDTPYDSVNMRIKEGVATPCFAANLIENYPNPSPEEDHMHRCTATSFYISGADTTASAIGTFFLMMTLHQDVQRKAQAELDSVLEPGTLPKFNDRSKLPYIDALIQEIHRCGTVVPLALPHRTTQEDMYEGYRIPAGATVIANSWYYSLHSGLQERSNNSRAVLHDPLLYSEPETFNPERYLSKAADQYQNPDPRAFAFGYGRRTCPGRLLADDSMFITVATVLASFNITEAIGMDGIPIKPDANYLGGALSHPAPFECRITPRFPEVARLITTASATRDVIG